MHRTLTRFVIAAFFISTAVSGCVGRYESDFQVVVLNRVANAIQVFANGKELGQVAPNQQDSFSIRLQESNPNTFTDGVGPTPQGEITLTAKDMRTGAVSTAKALTLTKGTPSSVTFAAADFPPGAPVIARFTVSPPNPGIDQVVQFNAAASSPQSATFSWNFGDGNTAAGVTTSHRFGRVGTFPVTLTLTTETGQTAVATSTVNVTTTLPPGQGQTVSFTFSPSQPAVNQDVFFNASTSNVSGATFTWDFGDGGTATGVTTTHRFVRAGTYAVVVRATNAAGQSGSASRTVPVSATSPQVTASFTFSPTSPGIGQEVLFNASASRPPPPDGTYSWSFGDGSFGSGVITTHSYSQAGTYAVTLQVANDLGQTATTSRTVTVTGTSPQVVASFTFSPTTPGINQDVFFNATVSRPQTAAFSWNFGDGSTGVGVTPTHRYTRAGTYTVTLTLEAETGQRAATSRAVTVLSSTVIAADFTFSPIDPSISRGTNTVIFDATPSSPGVTSWTWDFGDGSSTQTGQRTTHTFDRAGTWVVRLTVTDLEGRTASTTKNVTVIQ